jgi:hypothetical protein
MPESKLKQWCRSVEGPPASYEGKLALSNLIHDLDDQHVSKNVLRQLLRRIRSRFDQWKGMGTAALYIVTKIADDAPHEFFCHGQKGPNRSVRCSRVMLDRDFFDQNINNKDIGRLISGPSVADAHIVMVEKNLQAYAYKHFPPLTMKRSFVWVTETDALEKVVAEERKRKRQPADRVRNALGLAHFLPAGEPHLIEVQYPPAFFKKRKRVPFAAPTFLEGRPPNMVYRSLRNSEGWGITVDLDTGHFGLPEAVHGRIRFKGHFKIRNLGRFVDVTAGYSFEKMFDDAPTKWNAARIGDLEKIAHG